MNNAKRRRARKRDRYVAEAVDLHYRLRIYPRPVPDTIVKPDTGDDKLASKPSKVGWRVGHGKPRGVVVPMMSETKKLTKRHLVKRRKREEDVKAS